MVTLRDFSYTNCIVWVGNIMNFGVPSFKTQLGGWGGNSFQSKSPQMTHDSDLKLLNPVSSGFQALKKGISTMGFCTEHLLYIRYMRDTTFTNPFWMPGISRPRRRPRKKNGCLGWMNRGWDVWMLINRRKMRRISRRIKSFLFGKCNNRGVGHVLQVQTHVFLYFEDAWGVFGHDEKI